MAAAGNRNRLLSNDPNRYPAAYTARANIHNMIVVGASNFNYGRSHYADRTVHQWGDGRGSNFCAEHVCLLAPGANIRTTFFHNRYDYDTGTSFAAPFVAGTVALMLSVNPYLSPVQIRQILMGTVRRTHSRYSVSGGILNAYAAVRAVHSHMFNTRPVAGGIEIMSINGQMPNNLVIPNQINGQPVTRIAINAFRDSRLTSVSIPSTITHIGYSAFRHSSLSQITFAVNSQLRYIGEVAFGWTHLTSIQIPAGVVRLENSTFLRSPNLTTVTFAPGSQLRYIYCWVFRETNLTTLEIPPLLTRIQCGTLDYVNPNLTVVLQQGRTHIADGLFRDKPVINIVIPNGVTHIGANAFRGAHVRNVSIPHTITHIGYSAFRHSNLSQITFTANSQLRYIGEVAFGWTQLTSIQIPAGVVRLENSTFLRSPNLTTVTFAPGSQLRYIYCWVFRETNLTTLEIPPLLTRIQCGTLDYVNPNLTIVLQAGRTSISDSLFRGTSFTNLRTIVNNNTAVQQVNNTTFGNIDRSAIRVYIPIGTYAAYRAAGWHTFILVQR